MAIMNTADYSVLTPLHTLIQLLAFFQPPGELVSDTWVYISLQVLSHYFLSAVWVSVPGRAGLPCTFFSVTYVSFSFSVIQYPYLLQPACITVRSLWERKYFSLSQRVQKVYCGLVNMLNRMKIDEEEVAEGVTLVV